MKRTLWIITALMLSVSLTGCFGGSDEPDGTVSSQSFQNFALNVPSSWRKITREDFANTIPDETVALFLNRIEGSDFIQNANVVKESLNTEATSLEYAKANVLLGSKALVDYRSLGTEEADIGGVKTVLHVFRARNATTDPLRHYTQSYFSKDKIAYTVTCVSADEDEAQKQVCSSLVSSFRFQ